MILGFPGGTSVKEPACPSGLGPRHAGSIPGSGSFPGEGNGNQFQYSCLEDPTDRGAWRGTVHRVAQSRTRLKRLSMAHKVISYQFSSVPQSCPTLCDPMDCSMPSFPVHHQLPELFQTHVHWASDAIWQSHLSFLAHGSQPKAKRLQGYESKYWGQPVTSSQLGFIANQIISFLCLQSSCICLSPDSCWESAPNHFWFDTVRYESSFFAQIDS